MVEQYLIVHMFSSSCFSEPSLLRSRPPWYPFCFPLVFGDPSFPIDIYRTNSAISSQFLSLGLHLPRSHVLGERCVLELELEATLRAFEFQRFGCRHDVQVIEYIHIMHQRLSIDIRSKSIPVMNKNTTVF